MDVLLLLFEWTLLCYVMSLSNVCDMHFVYEYERRLTHFPAVFKRKKHDFVSENKKKQEKLYGILCSKIIF